jgi:hypothetical protein
MWFSKKYDNAPMPHSVFFSGGVALHATQATGMLGHPASHGCIRQSPANAATLYKLVAKHGNASTRITVHGTPRDTEPKVARRMPMDGVRSHPVHGAYDRPVAQIGSTETRRVVLSDGAGNRRVVQLPASDPRLIAYQRRAQQMAQTPRPQYGGFTYPGDVRRSW